MTEHGAGDGCAGDPDAVPIFAGAMISSISPNRGSRGLIPFSARTGMRCWPNAAPALLPLRARASATAPSSLSLRTSCRRPAPRDRRPSRFCIGEKAAAPPALSSSMQGDSGPRWRVRTNDADRRRRLPGRRRHRRARCIADRPRTPLRTPARSPRTSPASLPPPPVRSRTIPERHAPHRLRFNAARQRPPPPSPFSSLLSALTFLLLHHPEPSNPLPPSTTNLPSCLGPDPAHEPPW
jgi:hypothetical protein